MIISVKNARYLYGDELIFDNVNIEVNQGDRVGLVGGNGSGKTTLLRCIVGELSLFGGSITKASGLTIGYLSQNSNLISGNSVYQELMSVFAYEQRLVQELPLLSVKLQQCHDDQQEYAKISNRYQYVLGEIDRLDAYNVNVKVDTVLNGMNIMMLRDSVINTLSGGERTKVELCKLLLTEPQLLILDEPTNHLDLDTLEWLQTFLCGVRSSIILVSHDRLFLDKIANRMVELYGDTAYSYKGNYTQYVALREARLALECKEYARQQAEIAKLTDYIARNKVRASTANMAKSRQKTLDRMEVLDNPIVNTRPPVFHFACGDHPTEKVMLVKGLSVAFDNRTILDNVSITVMRDDRVAVIGSNGTGKSTLLRYIVGLGLDKAGSVIFGRNVRMGYYDQQNQQLDSNMTVLDQLWADNSLLSQTEIRSMLAMVNLTGEEVYKSVGNLSGGERARLALCMLMSKDNNLLILDEPTNHLDLLAREQLEKALLEYNGTLMFVSHDRYFVNKLSTKIVCVRNAQLDVHVGNYDSYMDKLRQEQLALSVVEPQPTKSNGYRTAKQRSQDAKNRAEIARLEKELDRLGLVEQQLNDDIVSPSVASDYKILADKCQQLEQVHVQMEDVLNALEQLLQ